MFPNFTNSQLFACLMRRTAFSATLWLAVTSVAHHAEAASVPMPWVTEKPFPMPWIVNAPAETKSNIASLPMPDENSTLDLCRARCAYRANQAYPFFSGNPVYGSHKVPRFHRSPGRIAFAAFPGGGSSGLYRNIAPPVMLYPPAQPYTLASPYIPAPSMAPFIQPARSNQRFITPPSPMIYVPLGLRGAWLP